MAPSMKKGGFQLDAKAYCILICGFSRRKRLQRFISGLVYTYNTLLSGLCKVGDFSAFFFFERERRFLSCG